MLKYYNDSLNEVSKKYNKTSSAKAKEEILKEATDLRNTYAKKVLETLNKTDAVFVDKKTGKMKAWRNVISVPDSYGDMTEWNKTVLISQYDVIASGNDDSYRLFEPGKDDISKAEKARWDEYVEWERDNNP